MPTETENSLPEIVPQTGGNLVKGEVLSGLSKVPNGIAHTVYVDLPSSHSGDFAQTLRKNKKPEQIEYRSIIEKILRHAWRTTHKQGSLFVRSSRHDTDIDLALVLGQICGGQKVSSISRPIANVAKWSVPRSDRETIYFIQASTESIYHPPTLPPNPSGLKHDDPRGHYREVSLFMPGDWPSRNFEFQGVKPPSGQHWRLPPERLHEMLADGYISFDAKRIPRLKRFLAEMSPLEMSLEWDDVPNRVPIKELVKESKWRGSQEPELLLERIIEMSSDPGTLVLVPFCDSGTAVVMAAKLGRRWIGFSSSEEGAKHCQRRLGCLPPAEYSKFRLSHSNDYAEIQSAEIDTTEVLWSSAEVLSIKKAVDKLGHLQWHSEFEKGLAQQLVKLGILSVPKFNVPGVPGRRFDFYLPQPPRGIVEVISAQAIAEKVSHLDDEVQMVRAALGRSALLYFVIEGKNKVYPYPELSSGARVIEGDPVFISNQLAKDFVSLSVETIQDEEVSSLIPEANEFSPEFMAMGQAFEKLFTAEECKVLHHEWKHLRNEWNHQHFTAAALRVGRSMEYVVYSACRAWGVKVREPVFVALKRLEDRFDEIRSAFLDYSEAESNALAPDKAKIKEKADAISQQVSNIIFDVDQAIGNKQAGDPPPRNVQSMLNDIKKKYGRLEDVRIAIDNQKKPVSELLKRRNAAAHASVDGSPREVTSEELRGMIEIFNQILNELVKCGIAIRKDNDEKNV